MATPDKPYEVSWNARNPENLNYARPTAFQLKIFNLPQVSFFAQAVTLPGMTLGVAIQPTPLADVPWPGEKLTFNELSLKFIIQSDFANYRELYNWFIGLGDPTNNNQYADWLRRHDWRFPYDNVKNKDTVSQQMSDGVLFVINANNVPAMEFHFHNLFPTSVTGVEFDISAGSTEYLTAYATFRYQYFLPVPKAT